MVGEEGPQVNIFEYFHVDRASGGLTNGIVDSCHMGTDRQSDRPDQTTDAGGKNAPYHFGFT